jgi:hypothetical protein
MTCTCGDSRAVHVRTRYYFRRYAACRYCPCYQYQSRLLWEALDLGVNILFGTMAMILGISIILALIVIAQNPYNW